MKGKAVPFRRNFRGPQAVSARSWMSWLADHTTKPEESKLPGLLRELARDPGVLLMLNHPLWLEEGVQEPDHQRALNRVLRECVEWFHALALNGTRSWSEVRRYPYHDGRTTSLQRMTTGSSNDNNADALTALLTGIHQTVIGV